MKTRITILIAVVAIVCLMTPVPGVAQNVKLDAVAKALGASGVKSLEITGEGFTYAIGQSAVPAKCCFGRAPKRAAAVSLPSAR